MCSDTAAATAAPPATASEPPSQKSFCTSTTISALVTGALLEEGGRDRGLAAGQLQALPRHGDERRPQPFAALGQRGHLVGGLSIAQQGDLEQAVVLADLGLLAERV